jgi:hypothetical protein
MTGQQPRGSMAKQSDNSGIGSETTSLGGTYRRVCELHLQVNKSAWKCRQRNTATHPSKGRATTRATFYSSDISPPAKTKWGSCY